jgi:hypothetical protein
LHLNCPQFYSCNIYKWFTPTFALSSTLVTYIKAQEEQTTICLFLGLSKAWFYFFGGD